jgi:hypothetical protein
MVALHGHKKKQSVVRIVLGRGAIFCELGARARISGVLLVMGAVWCGFAAAAIGAACACNPCH